jgi:DNA-binding MarR family transcriptional regulator
MKQQEITTLKLIESLERDPQQTQRDLARDLNISLGLVNSFTKRLIQMGFFKIKTIPKNRIKYILTPEGIYEKTRLSCQYLRYSLEFYKDTRAKIRSLFNQLSKQGKKKIFILGATELTEIAIITLQESRLELAGIIDNEKAGGKLLGTAITDHSSLDNLSPNDIVIITKTDSGIDLSNFIQAQNTSDSIIDLSK